MYLLLFFSIAVVLFKTWSFFSFKLFNFFHSHELICFWILKSNSIGIIRKLFGPFKFDVFVFTSVKTESSFHIIYFMSNALYFLYHKLIVYVPFVISLWNNLVFFSFEKLAQWNCFQITENYFCCCIWFKILVHNFHGVFTFLLSFSLKFTFI